MFQVLLYQPEIPPNTGNVIRLCANSGCTLHLIEPLGFNLSEPQLKRAGLDYHDLATVRVHAGWAAARAALAGARWHVVETGSGQHHTDVHYSPGDVLLFGPESRGLPAELLQEFPEAARVSVPMRPGNRSLNLSNSVAVVVYEAWRQQGFAGA
jgi:tRNA (cytidine/uridine-2'-O-)-methyltransferase